MRVEDRLVWLSAAAATATAPSGRVHNASQSHPAPTIPLDLTVKAIAPTSAPQLRDNLPMRLNNTQGLGRVPVRAPTGPTACTETR